MPNIVDKIAFLIYTDQITNGKIATMTGQSRSLFTHLIKNERLIENLTLSTALKIEKCYDELEKQGKIKYDENLATYYQKQKEKILEEHS